MEMVLDRERLELYLEKYHMKKILPDTVCEQIRLCYFKKGDYLCREDLEVEYLFFLVDGKCKVTKLVSNGKECLLSFYRTFTILGEFEFINKEDNRANTSVQALCDVWCLCIPIMEVKRNLMESVCFLRFLCENLCQKATRNNKNVSINLNYPVEQRVAGYIIGTQEKNRFHDNYTHLSEYLGCSHRQLLRVLCKLCEMQLLKKEKDCYRILNYEELEKLSGDVYELPGWHQKSSFYED